MEPFWSKFRAVGPWLQPGYDRPKDGKEYRIPQERMNVIHKEALCINCGCCVSECNAMESDPDFLGPQALAKAMRFVGDPRDGATVERLEQYNGPNGIWQCTRCFFCNERCPKGVDPRDAIAKLGAESIRHGVDRDKGARHAKWFTRSSYTTGWLRETELVPRTLGIVGAIKETGFARQLIMHNKAGIKVPPHVAEKVDEARALRDLVQAQGRGGALGIVQGERALSRLAHGHGSEELEEIYARPDAQPRPYLPNEDKGQAPVGGGDGGMGSRTQADVTPGSEPTNKPGGGA
jgi:succinate dehydrogenase / fumarate reductase, iron-sulfur subunit